MCIELYISTTIHPYTLCTFSSHSFQHRIVCPCGNIFSIFGAWAHSLVFLNVFFSRIPPWTCLLFLLLWNSVAIRVSLLLIFKDVDVFFSSFVGICLCLPLSFALSSTVARAQAPIFFPLHFPLYKYQPHSYFGFSFGLCVGLHSLSAMLCFVLVNGFDISDALPISNSCWNAMNHCFHSISSASSRVESEWDENGTSKRSKYQCE